MLGVYRIGANHQANGVARQRRTGGSLERLSGVANAAWVALVGVGVEIKLAMGMSVGLVGSARLFFWSVGGAVGVRFYDFIILLVKRGQTVNKVFKTRAAKIILRVLLERCTYCSYIYVYNNRTSK